MQAFNNIENYILDFIGLFICMISIKHLPFFTITLTRTIKVTIRLLRVYCMIHCAILITHFYKQHKLVDIAVNVCQGICFWINREIC